jgi:hypothetical protein
MSYMYNSFSVDLEETYRLRSCLLDYKRSYLYYCGRYSYVEVQDRGQW